MEDASGTSTRQRNGGGASLPPMSTLSPTSSSQASRKEWRVVSDQSIGNSSNEELEHSKVGQSDERLIYEVHRGRQPVDVDFCSVTIDEDLDNDILQQKLQSVSNQREELERMEISLRAQAIVRSEIASFQKAFDAQEKEHANVTMKLQEQLHEKEIKIHQLEKKLDERGRELHAIRLDNEAQAWAKDDLLREQNKELQNYRRERENLDAERAQHIKQIHDLQEHMQEKERQFMELQEQFRAAQGAIIYKDEQIRDAQTWITRAQEMESLQSTAIQNLQAELQQRTEQCNQLWLGCQRQFGEMERLHLQRQQLQPGTADGREKITQTDGLRLTYTNSNDTSQVGHVNGNPLEVDDSNSSSLPNGINTEGVHGVPYNSSIYGMPTFLPTAMHPFLMHQQGVPHPSLVTQAHSPSPHGISPAQNLLNQQALLDGESIPSRNQIVEKAEEIFLKNDSNYEQAVSENSQVMGPNVLNSKVGQGLEVVPVIPSPAGSEKVHDSVSASNSIARPEQNLEQISLDALRLNALVSGNETKEKQFGAVNDHEFDKKFTALEQSIAAKLSAPTEAQNIVVNASETASSKSGTGSISPVSTGQKSNLVEKPVESCLMDERAILACIARTIGSSGRIRISSTLPNRLGKMLAPLHWHDYKRKYGKLDEFVASHPELFLIEDEDYIQLRDGAQKIIAAMVAAAKIAAAPLPLHSSLLPAVAVTPMAQPHRLKKHGGNLTNSDRAEFPRSGGSSANGKQGSSRAISAAPTARR